MVVKFVEDWCGPSEAEPEKVPGFQQFVIEHFVRDCCLLSLLRYDLDLQDANTVSAYSEAYMLQVQVGRWILSY